MRLLTVVLGMCLLAAYACGETVEEASPTASPPLTASPSASPTPAPWPSPTAAPATSPAPTPSPVATPVSSDFERFLRFAPQVATAVEEGDAMFFAERAVETCITCEGNEQLGPCFAQPAGQVITGVPGTVLNSDAFALTPRDEFKEFLSSQFQLASPEAEDEFGSGIRQLYAIAQPPEGSEIYAVVTYIRADTPAGTARTARLLRFDWSDEEWMLNGEIVASVPFTAELWLSGECSECYDAWVRWEEKQ